MRLTHHWKNVPTTTTKTIMAGENRFEIQWPVTAAVAMRHERD
jgi:hypothetical protein